MRSTMMREPLSRNHLLERAGKLFAGNELASLVGGAAVPEALIRAFDRHGIWILQGWVMTETSPVCTTAATSPGTAKASAKSRCAGLSSPAATTPSTRRSSPTTAGLRTGDVACLDTHWAL
ncbi:MAG TPA: hypothetical protein VGA59_04020 [Ramlibacter sp.]